MLRESVGEFTQPTQFLFAHMSNFLKDRSTSGTVSTSSTSSLGPRVLTDPNMVQISSRSTCGTWIFHLELQSDTAPSSKPPVDIDVKVPFLFKVIILKLNFKSMSTGGLGH